MAAQIVHTDSREAWLEQRRGFITGTDMASILGLSPWRSPLDVYLEKKGLAELKEETEGMRWGKRMEPFILAAFAERTKLATRPWPEFDLIRDTEAPLGVTLDATCLEPGDGDDLVVPAELKNIRYARPEEWGEQGTDQIPNYYLTQVMLQIHLTERKHGYVVPLVAGQELRIYRVGYDPDLAAVMQERAEAWWKRHILGDEPPPVDGSDSAAAYLAKRFPRNVEPLLEASDELAVKAVELQQVRKKQDILKAQRDLLENQIKEAIGAAEGIQGRFGKITWKAGRGSTEVNFEGAYLELISALERDRTTPVRELADQLLKQFTTTKPAGRIFRPTWAKQETE